SCAWPATRSCANRWAPPAGRVRNSTSTSRACVTTIAACIGSCALPERVPLLVFADDWGRHPSSCQHLVRHLLPRREVVWVNTIMRPPRLDLATLRRGGEKVRQWLGAHGAAGPAAAG